MTGRPFTIAANQGAMGGGEVMLFAIAEAARELGRDVTVVAPADPPEVVERAKQAGFRTVAIASRTPLDYLRNLRRWDAGHRRGLLWCNGLRPAFATSGHRDRVVELHQLPSPRQRLLASLATFGARRVVVPSRWLAEQVPGSVAMLNWTAELRRRDPRPLGDPVRVGFLGRLSEAKGVLDLCTAVRELNRRSGRRFVLVLAGEARFVDPAERARLDGVLTQLGREVECPGWMSPTDFFRTVDLAVFPSIAPESFGLVAAESMASGTPFVISDAGALPEVAGDAWVARAGDVRDLVRVIGEAVEDPQRHVDAARRRWEQEFTPASGRARLSRLLAELDPEGPSPRIALAHDYLTQRGGAERVALTLAQAFPGAELVTSLYDPEGTYPEFRDVRVRTSLLNRVPGLRRHFRWGLPLFDAAFSTLSADPTADVLIASSTGFAHGVRTRGKKIVYCHSPARFLYLEQDYLGKAWWRSPAGWVLRMLRPALVAWDRRAARSADAYLCNSTIVQRRIAEVYGIHAEIVHPPASLNPADPQQEIPLRESSKRFYLVVSRLMPYKNVDVVIDSFRSLPEEHLLVIGRGPLREKLRANLPSNVTMAEGVSDAQMRWAYAHAEAVIAPSFEDFGLSPVEGFQFGTPTLALHAGGYLDTVVPGVSGWFFESPDAPSIQLAIRTLQQHPIDRDVVRGHGERFSVASFVRRIREAAESVA